MATDKNDSVTKNMFDNSETERLLESLQQMEKTLRRKINTEQNRLIKQIHTENLQQCVNLINKIQGL